MAPSPPRAKSSPVPIRRHTPSPSPSPYTSSRHSGSPVIILPHPLPASVQVVNCVFQRQSPYEIFVSPSSGPPSIHPIGSGELSLPLLPLALIHSLSPSLSVISLASSLARYHNPHSDVTDHVCSLTDLYSGISHSLPPSLPPSPLQGFVIVESPSLSSSPLSSTSSPRSGSYGSCRSHTPSSSGHTPSSYGSSSMQRFRSLTTPFYQAPPSSRSSNGSTPTVRASDVVANSPKNLAAELYSGQPRSHSNSSRRRCSEPNVDPLSHTPPFGRLMQLAVAPATTQSPPTTTDYSSPSPSSASPSPSQPSHAHKLARNVGVAVGGVRQLSKGGMLCSLSAHGSGSKLSSLAEQAEQECRRERGEERRRRGSRRGRKIAPKKGGTPSSSGKPEKRVYLDQLITASQILQSDEEEIEEEVDFPLSLSLQSSQSSSKTDEQDTEEEEEEEERERESGESEVTTPKFPAKSGGGRRRCQSAGVGRRGGETQHHSELLTENFQQINSRAASLSSHRSWLEGSGDSAHFTPTVISEYHFEVSPASEIKPVTPTFQLPLAPSGPPSSQSNCPPPPDPGERGENRNGRGGTNLNVGSSQQRRREGVREGRGVGEGVKVCLVPLQQAMCLAGELAAMAQARQGPIMLLSTDLVRHSVA